MSTENYDDYIEDVIGRANVVDTPELVSYYKDLKTLNTGALWTVANKIEPWEPKSESEPVLWRYEDLRSKVLKSAELVTPEQAGRRVVYLNNPGRQDVAAAVGWLYSGLQVMFLARQPVRMRILLLLSGLLWKAVALTPL